MSKTHGFWYNFALYSIIVVTAPVWIPVIIWAANETLKEQKL